MVASSPASPFPRLRPGHYATQPSRLPGTSHLIPIDSPTMSDAVVHIICSDAARAASVVEFFLSRSIDADVFVTASKYIDKPRSDRIACVILDLNLPDIGGLEAQSRLMERDGPPVIFVAARGDLNSGVRAMKNGAVDFISEPIDYQRLLAAVEIAFARERAHRRESAERLSLLRRWDSLTPREQDVFQFTVAGFLNKQAAAELGITENTFQVHRGRVMRKMRADSLAALVRMSTQLESMVHFESKGEWSTQSVMALLPGKPEVGLWNSSPRSKIDSSFVHKTSTPGLAEMRNLSYVAERATTQPRPRLAQRSA